MRLYFILFPILLLLLPACTMMRSIEEGIRKTNELVGTTQELVSKTGDTFTRTVDELNKYKVAADVNKDGETTPEEWIAYLVALVTTFGGVIVARNAKSNARKDVLEARVASLEIPAE